MNKANYGSVEACQRLLSANILLVTDMVWAAKDGCEPQLIPTEDVGKIGGLTIIPAVNFAEVWRELPETDELMDIVRQYAEVTAEFWQVLLIQRYVFNLLRDVNKMIDLLIWITEKKRKESNK